MGYVKKKVSSRITKTERDHTLQTVESLVERHLVSHVCPLEPAELSALWAGGVGEEESQAQAAMQRWWQTGNVPNARPLESFTATAVALQFTEGYRFMLQIPKRMMTEAHIPIWMAVGMRWTNPRQVLPLERAEVFEEWAFRAVHIKALSDMTVNVVEELIDISNTVGQLYRMAPDLVKYTQAKTQQALGEQERRSSLPEAWMEVDRMNLRRAMDHLGLCYLLPKSEPYSPYSDRPQGRDVMQNGLWVWAHTQEQKYAALPIDMQRSQFVYKLPRDANPATMNFSIP